MDEIRRLEQEIKSLQAQLRQQNAEAARTRQNLIEENRRSLQFYQNNIQRAVREHDHSTQAEFERLLSQYQKNLSDDVRLELSKLNTNYNQLLEDVKRNEAALLQKNQELERAIEAIRNDVTKRNEGSIQEAKEYLTNAVSTLHVIEAKPHEKFTPKRLQIFFNAIKDGQQLFKAGLFEAAAAVAISAKSGLERLGYTIDDKIEEWDGQYDLFSIKLRYLQAKFRQELIDWENYIEEGSNYNSQKKKLRLVEINYWSKGEFDVIFQGINKYRLIISKVNEVGKEAYLKQPDSVNTDDLKAYISEIEHLDSRLSQLSSLYKQRYSASCERSDWGEAIIDFLTDEINLIWNEKLTGYKSASQEVLESKDFIDYIQAQFNDLNVSEDTREWLRIVFENSSENHIYIYIFPIESHSGVVNHIVIHIDYNGPEQELYSKELYQHVCNAIQYSEEGNGIVNYAKDVNELKLSENKAYSETGKDLEHIKLKYKN